MPNQDFQNTKVDQYSSKLFDMKGRQIKNLGDATDPGDAVPLSQLFGSSRPAAGTYTIGASLTVGGKKGTITLNSFGQIINIQEAT